MLAKLQKVTISYVLSVCLSAHPSVHKEQLSSQWTDFQEMWHLNIFPKSIEKIQVSLKSGKNNKYFALRPVYNLSHLTPLFLEWEIFQTKL